MYKLTLIIMSRFIHYECKIFSYESSITRYVEIANLKLEKMFNYKIYRVGRKFESKEKWII